MRARAGSCRCATARAWTPATRPRAVEVRTPRAVYTGLPLAAAGRVPAREPGRRPRRRRAGRSAGALDAGAPARPPSAGVEMPGRLEVVARPAATCCSTAPTTRRAWQALVASLPAVLAGPRPVAVVVGARRQGRPGHGRGPARRPSTPSSATRSSHPRAVAAATLAAPARASGGRRRPRGRGPGRGRSAAARALAGPDGAVLVAGSLYLLGRPAAAASWRASGRPLLDSPAPGRASTPPRRSRPPCPRVQHDRDSRRPGRLGLGQQRSVRVDLRLLRLGLVERDQRPAAGLRGRCSGWRSSTGPTRTPAAASSRPAAVAACVALSVLIPFLGTDHLPDRAPARVPRRGARARAGAARAGAAGSASSATPRASRSWGGCWRARASRRATTPRSCARTLRQAGVASYDDVRDLDQRLTELEFRIRLLRPARPCRATPATARRATDRERASAALPRETSERRLRRHRPHRPAGDDPARDPGDV